MTPFKASSGLLSRRLTVTIGCFNASRKVNLDVSRTSTGFPNLASMNLAVTPMAFFDVYTPAATSVTPIAAAVILS